MKYLDLELLRPITDDIVQDIAPNYYVSNHGRVYSKVIHDFLKISLDHNGYSVVNLHLRIGKTKMCKVHRLVCKAFNPVPNMDNLQVNHINGIKTCNHINNLEWTTAYENIHHAIDTGLRSAYGENVHTAVLTNDVVENIARLLEQNVPYKDIINTLNLPDDRLTLRQIKRIRSKETWAKITEPFDFSDYNPRENYQIFSTEEIHMICRCFEMYTKNVSTEFVMTFLNKQDLFNSLSYDEKKKYYGAITKLREKSRFKDICSQYNF